MVDEFRFADHGKHVFLYDPPLLLIMTLTFRAPLTENQENLISIHNVIWCVIVKSHLRVEMSSSVSFAFFVSISV